ncbi:MAG TPA: 3-phosphoshikimate 1-carboxyvinyltransferase, partial [Massilibacterium sp.]|nr:3-phosphoshikimate 1-carboxyvinyltransferase [Massilibacterium sp.]
MKVKQPVSLKGELTIPGDKSISHRAVMFASVAEGTTKITNFLDGDDCLRTIDCFRKMGVSIEQEADSVIVHGKGFSGLKEPVEILDVGNSGTTT